MPGSRARGGEAGSGSDTAVAAAVAGEKKQRGGSDGGSNWDRRIGGRGEHGCRTWIVRRGEGNAGDPSSTRSASKKNKKGQKDRFSKPQRDTGGGREERRREARRRLKENREEKKWPREAYRRLEKKRDGWRRRKVGGKWR